MGHHAQDITIILAFLQLEAHKKHVLKEITISKIKKEMYNLGSQKNFQYGVFLQALVKRMQMFLQTIYVKALIAKFLSSLRLTVTLLCKKDRIVLKDHSKN